MIVIAIGTLIAALSAGLILLRPRRAEPEEFVLTLPAAAPPAAPGSTVRLRAVNDDGAVLEGDFVVVRACGAWLTVRYQRGARCESLPGPTVL
jgi:hypothetical protein